MGRRGRGTGGGRWQQGVSEVGRCSDSSSRSRKGSDTVRTGCPGHIRPNGSWARRVTRSAFSSKCHDHRPFSRLKLVLHSV